MFELKPKFPTNSHVYARAFSVFLKNILKQTWNSLNTNFKHQWNNRKSSYQVKQILGQFCYFIAPVLCKINLEGLRTNKNVIKRKVEGFIGGSDLKKYFQR